MEHRINARYPIEFDVSLNYRSLGLVMGRVKNISPDGAFVTTSAINIPKHQILEMVFDIPGDDSRELHKLSAVVVHEARDGMGLMFVEIDNHLMNLFNRIRQ